MVLMQLFDPPADVTATLAAFVADCFTEQNKTKTF
jgi:hypothetical protein